jgi:putative metallohydrolase (TIGR04338 family)
VLAEVVTSVAVAPPRVPRDAQRKRLYQAEHPLPSSPLPGLDACGGFADKVVGTLWWYARFPDHRLDRIPRLRPGHGARQALYREDDDGPTITLPRRYRTKGVMLHELAHWAMSEDDDLPHHGRTFARLLLDMTLEYAGPDRAALLAQSYREHKVHVGKPPLVGPDSRLRYGWDERLRLRKGETLAICHVGRGGAPIASTGVYEGNDRSGKVLRVRVGAAARPLRIPLSSVWDIRAAR